MQTIYALKAHLITPSMYHLMNTEFSTLISLVYYVNYAAHYNIYMTLWQVFILLLSAPQNLRDEKGEWRCIRHKDFHPWMKKKVTYVL